MDERKDNFHSFSNVVFNGLLWSYSEKLLTQLVSFVVSLILARLLLPEQYGIIALIQIFIIIANVFVTSGFGNSLIQKKDVDELDFSTIFYFSSVIAWLLYVLIYFSAPSIESYYNMGELILVIRVLSLKLPIAALNTTQHAYVSREMAFKKFFFSSLGGTVSAACVGIAMAYLGFGVWALVAQQLTDMIIDTIVLLFTVPWHPRLMFSLKRLKRLFNFGARLLVSDLISTIYVQIRGLAIGRKYGAKDLAYYNRGEQLPQAAITSINSAIQGVLFPAISKNQDDLAKVKTMIQRSIKITSFIICPMMVGMIAVAKPLVMVLYTEKWLMAVPYIQVLAIDYLLRPINGVNMQVIRAIGRSDVELTLRIIKTTLGSILLIVALVFFKDPIYIAYSAGLTAVICMFVNAYPNKKLIGYSYFEQLKDILPYVTISIIMGFLVYALTFYITNILVLLITQIAIGIVIYYLSVKLLKLQSMEYILSYVRSLKNKV